MENMDHPDGETSYAYNGIPSTHIIAESKTVVDGLQSFLHEINNPDFKDEWQKRNQESVNPVEAVIEFVSRFTDDQEWIDDQQTNADYMKMLLKQEEHNMRSMLDHSTVTVLFNNISMLLVTRLMELRLNVATVNSKTAPIMKMGFWMPPGIENNPQLHTAYSQIFANINDIKNQWFKHFDISNLSSDEIEQVVNDVSRIYPWGSQVIACLTCGMSSWRQLFKLCTRYQEDPEIRFILLHLSYKFKKRYPSCFQDMIVTDASGKTFGIDSVVSSADIWKDLKIEFKELT